MRLVVIDTETTGLSPKNGDKMVEIGAIAIEHGQVQMEQAFHRFIDPQCEIPHQVVEIHGIDAAKLGAEGAKPFAEIGAEFLEFIAGATLVFHNASFDLEFIKNELADAGLPGIDAMPVIDTLSMARQRFPKQPNNLDALCDRLDIDRSERQLHGALIDATLTAQAYLAMNAYSATPPFNSDQEPHPVHNISDLTIEVYHQLEQRHNKAKQAPLLTGLNSRGIPELDEKITGLRRGDLIIIAGKEEKDFSVSRRIVNHLAIKHFDPCSVTIFSLNRPATEWAEMLLSSEADVDWKTMQSGKITYLEWRKLAAASGHLCESGIHICDAAPLSVQDIRNTCIHLQDTSGKLGLIVIDDLQAITANEAAPEQNTDETVRTLKSLATELDAPIILISRLVHSKN